MKKFKCPYCSWNYKITKFPKHLKENHSLIRDWDNLPKLDAQQKKLGEWS